MIKEYEAGAKAQELSRTSEIGSENGMCKVEPDRSVNLGKYSSLSDQYLQIPFVAIDGQECSLDVVQIDTAGLAA